MTSVEITKAEYWLLDLVLDMWFPVAMLSEDVENFLNRPNHGLSPSELVNSLDKLFSEGYIVAKRSSEKPAEIELTLNREILRELLIDKPGDGVFDFYYGLTQKGGLIWEQLSQANWNQYKSLSLDADEYGNDVLLFFCTNSEIRDDFLYFYALYTEAVPILGTEKNKTLEPFQVTYWKTLSIGYEISYSIAASYGGVDADHNTVWIFRNDKFNDRNRMKNWLPGQSWYKNYFSSS